MSEVFIAPESNEIFSCWQPYHVMWVPKFKRPTPLALWKVQNTNDGVGISLWNIGFFERLVWLSQEDFIGPYMAVSLIPIQLFPGFSDSIDGLSHLTFRRQIKSRLPFAAVFRRISYSTRFQDKG